LTPNSHLILASTQTSKNEMAINFWLLETRTEFNAKDYKNLKTIRVFNQSTAHHRNSILKDKSVTKVSLFRLCAHITPQKTLSRTIGCRHAECENNLVKNTFEINQIYQKIPK